MLFPFTGQAETKYSEESVRYAINYVFGEDAPVMLSIAKCESGHNNLAINYEDAKITGSPSFGVLQINGYFDGWDMPYLNAKKAKELFDERGVYPWKKCAKALKLIKAT